MSEEIVQYIILRSDAKTVHGGEPSRGKLIAMACHASMAPFTKAVLGEGKLGDEEREWFVGIFTKILLRASLSEMNAVMRKAEEAGFAEKKDFFPIRDACLTEFVPDDESGRCLAAIGFRPMRRRKLAKIVKRLRLFS